MRPVLVVVPDEPKTILERLADMADEEYARAEGLAARVTELEEQQGRTASEMLLRLAEIARLREDLKECKAHYLLLRAAVRNVLTAHESGDEALLDEALARMEQIDRESSTPKPLRS